MENCFWCASKLDAYASSEFKGQETIVAKCPNCGEYTMMPDLVEILPSLTTQQRTRTKEFLKGSWDFLLTPQQIDKALVTVMLNS